MNPTLKTMLYGAGIATILLYVFDEELQPIINKAKEMIEAECGTVPTVDCQP